MNSQNPPAPADDYAGTLVFLKSMTWLIVLTAIILGFASLRYDVTLLVAALGFLGLAALLAGVTALIEMVSEQFHQQALDYRLRQAPSPDPAGPALLPSQQ